MTPLLPELIQHCKENDEASLQLLIDRYYAKAIDLAVALLRDEHLAEDAVQNSFLKVFCKLHQLREANSFSGWLRQIIRNECLEIIEKRSRPNNEVNLKEGIDLTLRDVEKNELREKVLSAFKKISSTKRRAAELFYLEENSYSEVAQKLGIPKGTVKKRLHSVRRELKGLLPDYLK